MSKEFLSQDEVDALIQGVNGDDGAAGANAGAEAASEDGVRPYDLATQERIVRGRMPTLEIIHERFARQLRIGLFNFVRRSAEITVGQVRVQKYGEFIRNLVVPTNLNLVQAKPLRGTALFVFDPSLVMLVVDSMFGGNGQFHVRVEGREFTQTEMRIIQRLLAVVFEELERAWAPVHTLKFEHVRSEMNTQFANIATPNEVVVVTTFSIDLGGSGGDLHLCLPYSMLEPVKDLLCSNLQGEQMEVDKRWVRRLQKEMQIAEVELMVQMGHAQLTLGEILNMRTGDVIALQIPQPMVAEVDGVPILECKCGILAGQYALKVERLLPGALNEN